MNSAAALAGWTILVAALSSTSCALLGCYLVLRRLSLLGDAISHAVLPGIVVGFLLTKQVTGLPILVGAIAAGMLTTLLTQTIHQVAKVPEDSSLGVVFTTLFALGVILMPNVDLDPGCVLYGMPELTAIDTIPLFGLEVPRVLPTLVVAFVLTAGFIGLLWKELKLVSFDPDLATALGINATLVHYLLMGLVAGVTVASFEAVGSILVVAMLIVPAATAQLLTDRLGWMLAWAVVVAVVAAVAGYVADALLKTSLPGMMAVIAGLQFLLALLLSPRHGLVARLARNARLRLRIVAEDLLGFLYRREEADAEAGSATLAGVPHAESNRLLWIVLPWLRWKKLVRRTAPGRFQLTDLGRSRGRSIVRAHRLWEAYLKEELDLPADHLHEPAERMEHFLGPTLQEEVAAQLQRPQIDPHGKHIPPDGPAID